MSGRTTEVSDSLLILILNISLQLRERWDWIFSDCVTPAELSDLSELNTAGTLITIIIIIITTIIIRICDRCVAQFDHHCPYIYNCVGLRNRGWFLVFTMSVAVNCSITIFFACYCIAVEGWRLLYIIGLIEALIFCGLGWLLSGFTVSTGCPKKTLKRFNLRKYFSCCMLL